MDTECDSCCDDVVDGVGMDAVDVQIEFAGNAVDQVDEEMIAVDCLYVDLHRV